MTPVKWGFSLFQQLLPHENPDKCNTTIFKNKGKRFTNGGADYVQFSRVIESESAPTPISFQMAIRLCIINWP